MISAKALVRNVAANEQDWNASLNSRPGTEYMCMNHVRHNEPDISESSGAHHLHKVKCYNFSEPMEEEASKVVYTGPSQLPNIPAVRGAPKPTKASSDKFTKKSKDGK